MSKIEFVKYNSLENHYRSKFIDNVELKVPDDQKWIATEKIHGANFSIWFNGDELQLAKRTGFIEDGDKFFNYQQAITNQLLEDIEAMYMALDKSAQLSFGDVLVIDGELYGQGVQRGVEYCDDQRFVAFGMRINNEAHPTGLSLDLMDSYGIPIVPILHRGTMRELIEMNNVFDSVLAKNNGIDKSPNIAEGFVISTCNTFHYLPSGSSCVIKSKNDKFSESAPKARKAKVKAELTDGQEHILSELNRHITDNRLKNVLSKIGVPTQKDFGKVMGLLTKDCVEEYNKENDSNITKDEAWIIIKNPLNKLVSTHIRSNWLNILDGEF